MVKSMRKISFFLLSILFGLFFAFPMAGYCYTSETTSNDPELLHITIVGNKDDPNAQALYKAALQYPARHKKVEWWDRREHDLPPSNIDYPKLDRAAGYICTNGRCSLPAFTPADLISIIQQLNLSTVFPASIQSNDVNMSDVAKTVSMQDKAMILLTKQNIFFIILSFFGFGLLLAFTPCVLPMLPILASIIVGEGKKITLYRAFTLSLTYVLAMATTYALAGIVAAIVGSYLQAYLQNPWVLVLFSLIFVFLALSLFGFYDLRLPRLLHQYLHRISNWYANETYLGVAIVGVLATLIASPCVTAPLAGVLGYISQTGDAWFGGMALFVMGIGMGIPLIIVGTLGGKFLPKSGSWLNGVKVFFGLILLGVAIWLLTRILPSLMVMLLWSMLAMFTAVYMGAFDTTPPSRSGKLWKGLSLIILAYGFAVAIGGFMGNTDPLQPLQLRKTVQLPIQSFQIIKTLPQLEKTLERAQKEEKFVLLDFYADWCISCQKMDKEVFTDPTVQTALQQLILLRVDVTNNTKDDIALTQYFKVIAPPTILFFDKNGREIKTRIVGEVNAKTFLQQLQRILSSS